MRLLSSKFAILALSLSLAVAHAEEPESAAPALGLLVPIIKQDRLEHTTEVGKNGLRIKLSGGSKSTETVQSTYDVTTEAEPMVPNTDTTFQPTVEPTYNSTTHLTEGCLKCLSG